MASRITVGEFNDSFKPIMDGVGLCVENYARWFDAKYGTAHVVAPHVPKYTDSDPFVILRYPSLPIPVMPPYRLGVPWASPRVGEFLTKTAFDLVHSHSPFVAGRMAQRTARRHDIPHVSTFHTKYRDDALRFVKSERLVDIFIHRIVRFYERCDAVWTPSQATLATLREYGYTGEITVAPNGSDLPRPEPEAKLRYRAAGAAYAGLGDDEFVFLFVGQHRWEKNVALVIRAIGRLHEAQPDAKIALCFVGEGYAAKAMAELAEEVKAADVTHFLGKIVDREVLKGLYARAELFFFPSLYDNAPLVMREAAAFGVPTVVAEGSSAAEIVVDGENGFVVPNDPDATARVLSRLVANRAAVARAGEGASQSIYLGWEEIVDWVSGEYERIVERFEAERRTRGYGPFGHLRKPTN